MRIKSCVLIGYGFAVLASASGCAQALGQTEVPLPKPTANSWTPPAKTSFEPAYVNAVKSLLGNGLSDPRGGEFHKVKVTVGDAAWAQSSDREAFGWVMPNHVVVGVDGLTYPIKEDLGAYDIHQLISNNRPQFGPSQAVPINVNTIATPGLLLVRGETELAEQSNANIGKQMDSALNLYAHLTNRYKMQVGQCLMDRKDSELKQWAEKLMLVSSIREKAGVNYPKDTYGWRLSNEEAKQIFSDAVRRSAHPKALVNLAAIAKLQPKARIAALIDSLDEVGAKQWGQPGGLDWNQDAIVQAVIKEGNAIVEPLIDAMEKDKRMTRSVSFGRDFFPIRTIHTVRSAANNCLVRIWPASNTVKDELNVERVKKLRKLWMVDANLTQPERWLNVLKDDNAGPEAWLQAGQALVAPDNMVRIGFFIEGSGAKPKGMTGEPLRAGRGGEMAGYLEKRIASMTTPKKEAASTLDLNYFANGISLAHCYGLWDARKALPTLQRVSSDALTTMSNWRSYHDYFEQIFGQPFAAIISDRVRAGDVKAAKDFAEFVPNFKFEPFWSARSLRPLYSAPNDASIQDVGKQIFDEVAARIDGTNSKEAQRTLNAIDGLTRSALIKSPVFRAFLAKEILSEVVVGNFMLHSGPQGKSLSYSMTQGGNGGMSFRSSIKTDGLSLERQPMTVGDFLAQYVGEIKDAPPFLMAWPKSQKARALQEMRDWLMNRNVNWDSVVAKMPFAGLDIDF